MIVNGELPGAAVTPEPIVFAKGEVSNFSSLITPLPTPHTTKCVRARENKPCVANKLLSALPVNRIGQASRGGIQGPAPKAAYYPLLPIESQFCRFSNVASRVLTTLPRVFAFLQVDARYGDLCQRPGGARTTGRAQPGWVATERDFLPTSGFALRLSSASG